MSKNGNGSLDLRTAVQLFIESRVAAARRPSTIRFYRGALKAYVEFAEGQGFGWPITIDHLRKFMLRRVELGNGEVTLLTYYRALSALCNWLELEELLLVNPIRRLDEPRLPKRIPRAVNARILKKLFDAMARAARGVSPDDPVGDRLAVRDYAMLRLCYDAGLRASELVSLKLRDLDLEERSIIVRGKGGNERVVYFGKMTRYALDRWLLVRQDGGTTLFLSRLEHPSPLTRKTPYYRLQYWLRVAGIRSFRLHDLRHSCATHLLRNGMDIESVQRQLGHSALSVTAKYLWSDDQARKEAYRVASPGDALMGLDEQQKGQ